MNQREAVLDRVNRVPALPVATVKVIEALQNSSTDLYEIARVIQHDPGLCANLLRLANSALFGTRRDIDSLDRAIARLGTRRILDLVVGSTIKPMAWQQVRGYDLAPGDLWRHSIAVACGTEELAKVLNQHLPDSAFTAGLLIDIGKSVLGNFLHIDGQAILALSREQGIPFEQAEREVLGIDHAEVGAALLTQWQLPQSIISVVRWHHQPDHCPETDMPTIHLVHAADLICTTSGIGIGKDGMHYAACETSVQQLNLTPECIERAMCGIAERIEALQDVLNEEPGS